jgi:hypothetical protein
MHSWFPARSFVAFVVALSLVLFQVRPARAGDCTTDAECKGDRICEGGKCVSPPAPVPARPATPTDVLVSFDGNPGDQVSFEGIAGTAQCQAPCSVSVPAGSYTLRVTGSVTYSAVVDVLDHPVTIKLRRGAGRQRAPSAGRRTEGTRLSIESRSSSDTYAVSVEDSEGQHPCAVPCSLTVVPGTVTLRVSGTRSYVQRIAVGDAPTRVTLKRACTGCFVGGAVMAGVGLIDVLTFTALIVAVNDAPAGTIENRDSYFAEYGTAIAVGGTVLGVGLFLIVVGLAKGGSKAVVEKPEASMPGFLKTARFAAVPGGGGASVSF